MYGIQNKDAGTPLRIDSNQGEDAGEHELTSPMQKQRMDEKRELRDLNHRLELFVRHQRDGRSEVNRLKKLLADSEVEFRQRIKDSEKHYQLLQDKIIAENEQLTIHNKTLRDQFENAEKTRQSLESRCTELDQELTRKMADIELKGQTLKVLQNQMEALSQELITAKASLKASSKNDEQMAGQLQEQCEQWKAKFDATCEELAKTKSRHKCQVDSYQRALLDKADEIEKLKEQLTDNMKKSQGLENQVRKEFDTKMAEFVEKREIQYQSEKEEWVRIFKEEFQKKVANYKDSNAQYSETNKKLETEINDLKSKLARTRREKAELETEKHALEEEMEKYRNDMDELRQNKTEEIREKIQLITTLEDTIKQKDLEYEELSDAKVQLDNEITLYRNILSDAEKEAGYFSPLELERKKRITNNGETCVVPTPGLARARQVARQALEHVGSGDADNIRNRTQEQEDLKKAQQQRRDDAEEEIEQNDENVDCSNYAPKNNSWNENHNNKYFQKRKHPEPNEHEIDQDKDIESDTNTTPGELYPLQFSTMDLSSSTLEIQNISDHEISLKGFYLTNSDTTKKFLLPSDRILASNERVKIIIGNTQDLKVGKQDIWWHENVWSGLRDEVARLYNPKCQEIARIEISPEMLPERVRTRKNCLIM